jgi:hypothetical protein
VCHPCQECRPRSREVPAADFLLYEAMLRRDGFDLAADGVRRMREVYEAGVVVRSSGN